MPSPEEKLAHYQQGGAVSSDINDAEHEFLAIALGEPGAVPDLWFKMLRRDGYTGALPDMLDKYWRDQWTQP